jgi:hypothetical protein
MVEQSHRRVSLTEISSGKADNYRSPQGKVCGTNERRGWSLTVASVQAICRRWRDAIGMIGGSSEHRILYINVVVASAKLEMFETSPVQGSPGHPSGATEDNTSE